MIVSFSMETTNHMQDGLSNKNATNNPNYEKSTNCYKFHDIRVKYFKPMFFFKSKSRGRVYI